MVHRVTVLLIALVTVFAVTACGDDDAVNPATPSPTPLATDPSPTPTPTSGNDPTPTDTAGEDPTEDPVEGPSPTEDATDAADGSDLPGEVFDLFPYADAELAVVGVEADDTLNVRSGPGVSFDVVIELVPLAQGVIATGHNRQLDSGAIWSEITTEGVTGWANTRFLTHLGLTEDVTSRLFPAVSDRPQAETMLELGQLVGEQVASDEPPSTITVVDGPTVGDLGEITVDVIGLGDDSANGLRLHVFAEPDPGGERFTVRTVEQTAHCTRGVTGDGLCL